MIKQVLKTATGFDFKTEHRFCDRRWRFDYACEELKLAVEVEGGAFTQGRHTRGKGFVNDMEKYNKAIELGWVVLRYTPDQMNESKTYKQISTVCENRKHEDITNSI